MEDEIPSQGEFTAEDLFDYVDGLSEPARAAAIRQAAIHDEELAARITFMRVFGGPVDQEEDEEDNATATD